MSKNLSPRQSLNKSFLKIKPNRIEIENFKRSFITLLDDINEKGIRGISEKLDFQFSQAKCI
jgi:hypothetical protein